MNLSEKVFQKFEALRRQEERRLGIVLSWDAYFLRAIERRRV